jgi:hypothetical protein
MTYEMKKFDYLDTCSFHIYIKSNKIERVKPPQFVYHTSNPNRRNMILKDGLIPMSENWGADLNYKPAIFASTDKDSLFSPYGKDVWKIDTSKIKNIWYLDLNLNKYANESFNKFIMTYEPIPLEVISLYQKIEL